MPRAGWQELVERTLAGESRALAKLVTRVENRAPGWREAMKALHPHTGKARVLGITGSPGAGKSSLTNRLAAGLVERGHRVGVVAVDPSSPFSGGALLGDRLRMNAIHGEQVYVRSMATRQANLATSAAVRDGIRVLKAAGNQVVIAGAVGEIPDGRDCQDQHHRGA